MQTRRFTCAGSIWAGEWAVPGQVGPGMLGAFFTFDGLRRRATFASLDPDAAHRLLSVRVALHGPLVQASLEVGYIKRESGQALPLGAWTVTTPFPGELLGRWPLVLGSTRLHMIAPAQFTQAGADYIPSGPVDLRADHNTGWGPECRILTAAVVPKGHDLAARLLFDADVAIALGTLGNYQSLGGNVFLDLESCEAVDAGC